MEELRVGIVAFDLREASRMDMVLSRQKLLELMPFYDNRSLYLDEVTIDEPNIIGGKTVYTGTGRFTVKKQHCQGHLVGNPLLPGHILSEAVAQTIGVLAIILVSEQPEAERLRAMSSQNVLRIEPRLVRTGNLTFRKESRPGDNISILGTLTQYRATSERRTGLPSIMFWGQAQVSCNDQIIATMDKPEDQMWGAVVLRPKPLS